ncbi:transglutaminase [Novosphingobium sp. PC22D]|uniref:transglutaminase family protein n=1 Tax=Novosphingobium sp. PC22D TaxID=1962403 RepID=UPI000BF1514C|nr:transglutaminase family protein [Novosphingobium sp. PC22D]PEQ12017.1 transglutaminase [Novosphingobium sp. PC22D]
MELAISHTTRYRFSQPVSYGLQRLRLRPKSTHGQEVLDWDMHFEGAKIEAEYDDQNNNHVVLVSIEPGVQNVAVTCKGLVATVDKSGVIGEHCGHMPLWCFLRPTPLTRAGLKVRALVAGVEADKSKPIEFLHALSTAVAEAVEYEPGKTSTDTSAEQALTAGHGVCQDHAHIFISAGRLLDIPMRYVGGYLKMEDRVDQDAGHGWAEAYVQGLGWAGFDVSNGMCPDERYVRVATGCDYSEAAPVKGIDVGTGESSLEVHLSVEQKMVGQQQQQSSGGQQQSQGG